MSFLKFVLSPGDFDTNWWSDNSASLLRSGLACGRCLSPSLCFGACGVRAHACGGGREEREEGWDGGRNSRRKHRKSGTRRQLETKSFTICHTPRHRKKSIQELHTSISTPSWALYFLSCPLSSSFSNLLVSDLKSLWLPN